MLHAARIRRTGTTLSRLFEFTTFVLSPLRMFQDRIERLIDLAAFDTWLFRSHCVRTISCITTRFSCYKMKDMHCGSSTRSGYNVILRTSNPSNAVSSSWSSRNEKPPRKSTSREKNEINIMLKYLVLVLVSPHAQLMQIRRVRRLLRMPPSRSSSLSFAAPSCQSLADLEDWQEDWSVSCGCC